MKKILSINLTRMDETAKEIRLLSHEKFRTEVYLRIIDQSTKTYIASFSEILPKLAKPK